MSEKHFCANCSHSWLSHHRYDTHCERPRCNCPAYVSLDGWQIPVWTQ